MVKQFMLASALCCALGCAQTENPAPAPVAKPAAQPIAQPNPAPTTMPVPPQQNAAWAHEDDEFSQAVATLFEQGLADPRGLEYREIEIPVGNPWDGGGAPMKTHGWVLPAEVKGTKDRFAVAWNGLIYPVVKIGAPADVRADWAPDAKNPRYGFSDYHQTLEDASVNYKEPGNLKMALLLRLGETEIVERLRKTDKTRNSRRSGNEFYLNLASDWAWFAFERAVCAHERGDDKSALDSAQLLTRIAPLIEAEAKRRDKSDSNGNFAGHKTAVLPFLEQLPALLRDSQRRLNQGATASASLGEKATVAQLIDDLQNVDERQFGQPGGVSLAQNARVRALVKRGDSAVEPLLQALKNDDRLTRSVSFGRDFFRRRELISVSSAAYAALSDLMRVDFTRSNAKGEPLARAQMAQQIRAYWKKMSDLAPAERFYITLRDDKAGKEQWMQAAANLVQPTDVESHGGWTTVPNRKPNHKAKLRGEKLRDGRTPSVAQLLAKRSDDIAAIRTGSSQDSFLFIDACQMALALAEWDKAAAIPVLKKRLARAYSIGAQPNDNLAFNGNPAEKFGAVISKMTLARARAGDVAAYDDYAQWIVRADLKFSFGGEELQKPLIQGASRPSIGRAIDFLFNDPKSAWSNVFAPRSGFLRLEFWQSPLVMTRGFRKQALRGLSDKTASGTITFNPRTEWNSRTEAQIEFARSNRGFRGSAGDPATPPPGQKRAFRVCDFWAYLYARDQGGPKMQLFWPQPKRDAAVAACRSWLQNK